jgi:multidrug efflux pump subunit AcrA (membrane-fusion protein)
VSISTSRQTLPSTSAAGQSSSPRRVKRAGTSFWIVNGVLAAAVLAIAVGAYLTLGSSSSSATAATRTSTVQRGVVMTSVSASGAVQSSNDVSASFQTSGTLSAVSVKAGQHVAKGQVLARIDSLSARQALSEAQANLATAQGRLQQTTSPLNAQEQQQLTVSSESAAASVTSAQTALSDQQAQNALDLKNAQQAVTQANAQLKSDQAQHTTDAAALKSAETALTAATGTAVTTAQQKVTSAQTTLAQDDQKVTTDTNAVKSATANVASTTLKGTQALHQAQQQLDSAKLQQKTTLAGNAVKTAPPKPGDLASAKAAVVQAQVGLAQAKLAVSETTLRAPVAGTIATVNGSVGDQVSGGGSNTPSTTPSTSSTSSSAASSSSTSSSSSSSSSFVTITQDKSLQVVAGFSEGDAASIKLGQAATATISALPGVTLAATVVGVDSTATTVSNVVTYNVTFALVGSNAKLKPGMTAAVQVVTAERENVLNVTSGAVTGSGSNASLRVVKNGKETTVPVVAGLRGDDTTEIVSGVSAGTTVALPALTLTNLGTSSGTSTTTGAAGATRARGGAGLGALGGGGLGGP